MTKSSQPILEAADMQEFGPSCLQGMEQGDAESAGMGEVFRERTGHLSAQHAAFFAHWYHLVALEESGLTQKRAEIWSMTGGLSNLNHREARCKRS